MPESATPERPTPPDDTAGLREQLAKALWARVTAAVLPEPRPLPDGAIGHFVGVTQYDLADTALAVLVEPPGDLREQMAEAIRAAARRCDDTCGEDCTHIAITAEQDDGRIFYVEASPDAIAEAALSVCWEDAARRIAAAEARADGAERERDESRARWYASHEQVVRELEDARIDLTTAQGQLTDERAHSKRAYEKIAALEGDRDELHETIAAADADRDRLEAQVAALRATPIAAEEEITRLRDQVAALQRDLAEARADREQLYTSKRETFQALGRETERAEQAERELTEAKRAVYTTHITHARAAHPDRLHAPDCPVCAVLVPLSLDLPRHTDDIAEIRRLAQATTEETRD